MMPRSTRATCRRRVAATAGACAMWRSACTPWASCGSRRFRSSIARSAGSRRAGATKCRGSRRREPGATMRITVLDHPATLAGHMAAWNDLAAATLEPNAFYEPWMMLPAIDSFGRGAQLRYVLVYADQGGATPLLCGLFPLEGVACY